jgi:hypothetical protein
LINTEASAWLTVDLADDSPTGTGLSVPMDAPGWPARPGVREIRISYGGGGSRNGRPRQFAVVPSGRSHNHHPPANPLRAA